MQKKDSHINKWLLTFSWVYRFIMYIRKKLFDWNIFKQESYDIPVICVGNITVGGTGKTPHIEYLVKLLKKQYKVAVLSRGYKRKSNGFVLADENSTYQDIGDEPAQIKHKFPDIIVAVDANRRRGIRSLLEMNDKPDVILLDDAFQHRYVKPSFSILLNNYHRPIYRDKLLPAGRLRESIYNKERANILIVTKCPEDIKPIDMRIIYHDLDIYPYQTLLFTTLNYGNLVSLFNKEELPLEKIKNNKVLVVTGIASPDVMMAEIGKYTQDIKLLSYPDHHNFTAKDITNIETTFAQLDTQSIVIVTEKDAMRLIGRKDLSDNLKSQIYYLPIEVSFVLDEEKKLFNKKINSHVKENTRNSQLH